MEQFRLEHIPSFLLFSTALISFLLGVSAFMRKTSQYEKFIYIAIHYTLGIMLIEHAINNYYLSDNVPYLFEALLGWMELHKIVLTPLFLLCHLYYTGIGSHFRPVYLLHFLPFALVSVLIALSAAGIFRFDLIIGRHISDLFDTEGALLQIVYTLIIIADFFNVRHSMPHAQGEKLSVLKHIAGMFSRRWFEQVGIYFAIGIWGVLLSIVFLVSERKLFDRLSIVPGAFIVFYSFFRLKTRDAVRPGSEMRNARYAAASDNGVTRELLSARLDDLMNGERVWLDEELSLPSLAAMTRTTTHRLSAHINDVYAKNFNAYINGYRIEEAKRLLAGEPEWSVLRVALMSGFNSKSVFYRLFTKSCGISPTQYRERLMS